MQRIWSFCCIRALREASAQCHFVTTKYSRDNNFVIKGLSCVSSSPRKILGAGKKSSLCKPQMFGSLAHSQGYPDLPPDSTAVPHLDVLWEAVSRSKRDISWSHKWPPHFELQLSSSTLTLYAGGVAERRNNCACVRAWCRTIGRVSTLFEPYGLGDWKVNG